MQAATWQHRDARDSKTKKKANAGYYYYCIAMLEVLFTYILHLVLCAVLSLFHVLVPTRRPEIHGMGNPFTLRLYLG